MWKQEEEGTVPVSDWEAAENNSQKHKLWNPTVWNLVPSLLVASIVTLGGLVNLSVLSVLCEMEIIAPVSLGFYED